MIFGELMSEKRQAQNEAFIQFLKLLPTEWEKQADSFLQSTDKFIGF